MIAQRRQIQVKCKNNPPYILKIILPLCLTYYYISISTFTNKLMAVGESGALGVLVLQLVVKEDVLGLGCVIVRCPKMVDPIALRMTLMWR